MKNSFTFISYLLTPIIITLIILFVVYKFWGYRIPEGRLELYLGGDFFFWFFSSIFQGFLALLAILGTVAIFKAQSISNEIKDIANSCRSQVGLLQGAKVSAFSISELSDFLETTNIEEYAKINPSKRDIEIVKTAKSRITELKKYIRRFRARVKAFFIVTSLTIMASLILMPATNFLSSSHPSYWGFSIFIVMISLSGCSIMSAFILIEDVFEHH